MNRRRKAPRRRGRGGRRGRKRRRREGREQATDLSLFHQLSVAPRFSPARAGSAAAGEETTSSLTPSAAQARHRLLVAPAADQDFARIHAQGEIAGRARLDRDYMVQVGETSAVNA